MLGQGTMPASIWGSCERCGAPKAPTLISGGGGMILCTRCTSAEDQKAILQAEEYGKRLGRSA